MSDAAGLGEDHILERVPEPAKVHWSGVCIQLFGQVSDLTVFLTGAILGAGLSFWGAFWALTLGTAIAEVLFILVGIIGMREGLATAILTRWTGFGRYGSAIIGLMLTVSTFGWFGVQTAIFAEGLFTAIGGIPVWGWTIVAGLLVTTLVLGGFRWMGWTAWVTVPAFLGLVGWAVWKQVSHHDVGALISSQPFGEPLTIGTGATIVAGGSILIAVTASDMTRFSRNTGDVVKQTVVGFTFGGYVMGLIGVLLAYAVRSSDVIAIMTASVGMAGVIILVSATVKINNWNLYSCALGLSSAVESLFNIRLGRVRTTVLAGILGTLVAITGILDSFQTFLVALGVISPPIVGIMLAEYFVVKRWRAPLDASRKVNNLPDVQVNWVPASLVLWLVGAVIGFLSDSFSWWGIPAVNAILVSGIGYMVADRMGLVRGVGRSKFDPAESQPTIA